MSIDDLTKIRFKVTSKMRYQTPGDYFHGKIILYDKLTDIEKLAVGAHEFVEMIILHMQGVTDEQIDEWDMEGKDRDTRYTDAHNHALRVEQWIINLAGGDWPTHNNKMETMKIKTK